MLHVVPEGLKCHRGRAGLAWLGEESQFMTSPSGGREKSRACVWHSGFSDGYPRDLLLPHLTGGANRELAYFGCLGHWDKRRVDRLEAVAPQELLYHKQTPEGARDYERLKKKPLNPIGKWHLKTQKIVNPQKMFQKLPEFLARISRILPYAKADYKDWEWWLFFQIHTTQQKKKKFKRHIKKQGYMAKSQG